MNIGIPEPGDESLQNSPKGRVMIYVRSQYIGGGGGGWIAEIVGHNQDRDMDNWSGSRSIQRRNGIEVNIYDPRNSVPF